MEIIIAIIIVIIVIIIQSFYIALHTESLEALYKKNNNTKYQ